LVSELRALARQHPRFGYRRIHQLLLKLGWSVNRKRVHRLWKQEGLRVPQTRRKRRRLGDSANGCIRRRAQRINHVWTYDFVHDRTEDGRRLKILTIVDEYSRECLNNSAARSITAEGVIATLAALIAERGPPGFLRSDNGPEFIAEAVRCWLQQNGIQTLFIEPGAPWENAYIESFNGKLSDELLDNELFYTLEEANFLLDQYREHYNHERPHSSLGYRTPSEFAASCAPSGSATLRLRAHSSGGALTMAGVS
jgi:putative transposase